MSLLNALILPNLQLLAQGISRIHTFFSGKRLVVSLMIEPSRRCYEMVFLFFLTLHCSNADCNGDVCYLTNCIKVKVDGCAIDADCVDPAGSVCDPTSALCVVIKSADAATAGTLNKHQTAKQDIRE